jgi:hypothetical protein
MRTLKCFLLAALVAAVAGLGVFAGAADVKDIETIMDKAHKMSGDTPSLLKTVVTGKASKEEKEELLALYIDLSKNKPPKGDEADWKKRTDGMVAAAKDVVAGKPDATKALAKAVNCKGCHQLHKSD